MNSNDFDARWAELTTPKQPFPFLTNMTDSMDMSDGLAWVADLYMVNFTNSKAKPVRIGQVENKGDGGADYVWIFEPTHRALWKAAVEASFPSDKGSDWCEEYATAYLAEQEEKYILSKAGA